MLERSFIRCTMLGILCLGMVFMNACASTLSDSVSGSIVIDAPVQEVFAYMDEEGNALEWNSALKEIKDLTGTGVGATYKWTYEMAGRLFHGDGIVVDYVPNQREVLKSTGDIDATWTFIYVPEDGKTKVIILVEYSARVPSFASMARKSLAKKNQQGLDEALIKLKSIMEK